MEIVGMADAICKSLVSAGIVPVGEVAKRDKWFSNNQVADRPELPAAGDAVDVLFEPQRLVHGCTGCLRITGVEAARRHWHGGRPALLKAHTDHCNRPEATTEFRVSLPRVPVFAVRARMAEGLETLSSSRRREQ
jgi:hypothetical protein